MTHLTQPVHMPESTDAVPKLFARLKQDIADGRPYATENNAHCAGHNNCHCGAQIDIARASS